MAFTANRNHEADIKEKLMQSKKELINLTLKETKEQMEHESENETDNNDDLRYDNLDVINQINNLNEYQLIYYAVNSINENLYDEVLFDIKDFLANNGTDELPF